MLKGRTKQTMADKKVILKSDFRDYYDPWFDIQYSKDDDCIVFERMSDSGMTRPEMFDFFASIGIKTPNHGTPEQILRAGFPPTPGIRAVVVYTDPTVHRGDGKALMPILDAIQLYPNCFASEYIEPLVENQSHRYLSIGGRGFWLTFTSADDWRSNCGDVTIEIQKADSIGCYPNIKHPLYAIDYVQEWEHMYYGVDFNIAPQIKGTGIEKVLPSPQVAELIMAKIKEGSLKENKI